MKKSFMFQWEAVGISLLLLYLTFCAAGYIPMWNSILCGLLIIVIAIRLGYKRRMHLHEK